MGVMTAVCRLPIIFCYRFLAHKTEPLVCLNNLKSWVVGSFSFLVFDAILETPSINVLFLKVYT